ncbi:NGFI-A-binding protein 1, partial [Orchesella cincta]
MMIELGGDDVQQLCEAGEAEFLEIMALIGMAAKPLHVRRLQKALQEWMTQPSLFQSPVLPPGYHHYGASQVDRTISHTQYTTTTIASNNVTGGTGHNPHHPVIPIPHHISQNPASPYPAHNAPSMQYITDSNSTSSNDSTKSDSHKTVKSYERSSSSPSNTTVGGLQATYLAQQGSPATPVTNSPQTLDNSSGTTTAAPSRVTSRSSSRSSSYSGSEPSSPPAAPSPAYMTKGIILQTGDSPRPSTESLTNRAIPASNNSVTATSHDYYSLQEHEIQKLAEAAMNLVRSLPQNVKEPKFSKKIETSSYETVVRLAEDDPRKMDEIRRLSAIFGRSEHGKRNKSSGITSNSSTKPVSVLELSMNESAAQLCRLVPALLTRREELFTLSRQVIRDSGLPYAVISANSNLPGSFMFGVNNNNNNEVAVASKLKIVELRNSPAHEERISYEFAAACKKIKFDMQCSDNQDKVSHHAPTSRKSPPRDNIVTATALKRMALATPEFRRNIDTSI